MYIIRSFKYIASLQKIMNYISKDSKNRALEFRNKLENQINNIILMPYKCRKSIYFKDENIRDLIHKGYTIVYKVDEKADTIIIIGIKKYTNSL